MSHWWARLSTREQRMLLLGGLALLVMLPYWLIWMPLVEHTRMLERRISTLGEDLVWMQAASDEVQRLGGAGVQVAADRGVSGQSLLGLVDSSVREAGLASSVRRVQPDGDQRVQLWMEAVEFDTLLSWLARLQSGQGVQVERFSADRRAEPGLVDSQLNLVRGALGGEQ